MSEVKLEEVFKNEAVEDFGSALRRAVRMEDIQDYASLVELEYVETKEDFAEVIKKFLRRYHTHAKKFHLKIPKEESLDGIMQLIDELGVKLVRAALISHALVKSSKEEEKPEGG
ncbi:MAG TPA: hypothetical protein EYP78_06010 [Candidatus Omnitrophica bacterium]|nr:hypothetical protein [Candidatus Omnitrophota bacterium]